MRKTLLVGLVLTVATVLVVLASDWFDLELESVALLGVTLGAVVALVPDRSPLTRLAGFAAGFVIALIGFFIRAAMLPDSPGGRTVAFALIVLAVSAAAAVSAGRLPLWSTVLGAAGLAGAFEYTYAAAPTEVVSSSMTMLTATLLTFAVGFIAAAAAAPQVASAEPIIPAPRREQPQDDDATHRLDDMMETK